MNTFKQRLFTNWHLVRIMRLGIGTMLLVTGIQNKEWAIGLFSLFFIYQAVTDTGCCSSGGYCPPSVKRRNAGTPIYDQEIEYKEIK
ncbi:MAG: hypothetical protein H7257_09215 [Taibaiella sp.]|nr:hypothetical protein [Taibaiella sp.]